MIDFNVVIDVTRLNVVHGKCVECMQQMFDVHQFGN